MGGESLLFNKIIKDFGFPSLMILNRIDPTFLLQIQGSQDGNKIDYPRREQFQKGNFLGGI